MRGEANDSKIEQLLAEVHTTLHISNELTIVITVCSTAEPRDVQGLPEIPGTVHGAEGPDVPADGDDAAGAEVGRRAR